VTKYKVRRNQPCPCGSGKKYKNCCYPDKTQAWKTAKPREGPAFSVELKETPKPITSHLVSSDGGKTWQHRPGSLVAEIHGRDLKDIDETISQMIKSVYSSMKTLDLTNTAKQDFIKHVENIDYKLHAVKYHLNNFKQAESDKIEELNKNYKPPTGVQIIIEEPRLIYEVEAFL